MGRSSRSQGRSPGSSRPRTRARRVSTPRPRTIGTLNSNAEGTGFPLDQDLLSSYLQTAWRSSRHGAIASRGFHYQDAVGAWLGLRILNGGFRCQLLVPEGFEDLTCEGGPAEPDWHVQVKSRQARIGDFSIGQAVKHLLGMWLRHGSVHGVSGRDTRLVLVLERPVGGVDSAGWGTSVSDMPRWAPLAAAATAAAAAHGLSEPDVQSLLARSSIVVLPWSTLTKQMAQLAAGSTHLPLGAAAPVVNAILAEVALRVDRNAASQWKDREGLSASDITRIATSAAALVDRESLFEAVRSGACEPIDLATPLADPRFFEGVSVQPGHVAAGFVTSRPQLTDMVLEGLDRSRRVLITGPSGVGKSALTWLSCFVAGHVAWYRVQRLTEADVEPLVRLARAMGPGASAPVGFVVDGVGTGSLTAWDSLCIRLRSLPHVVLLGSVREEDLLVLESAVDCVLVRPRLDEELAGRLYTWLAERRATVAPHWREAFEETDGLTLEFTHLLTQGRRLQDVVTDQIASRIRDRRDDELAVLAVVATAHRWGASLPVEVLKTLVGVSDSDVKAALGRLIDEHVLTITGGLVTGLHPLRSKALSEAIHQCPPPLLGSTIGSVLGVLPPEQLRGFVANVVADRPDLLHTVEEGLLTLLGRPEVPATWLAAALQGARLADFTVTSRRWAAVVEAHGVRLPLRPLAMTLAMIDSDLSDALDPALCAAVAEIRSDRDGEQAFRRSLLEATGLPRLAEVLSGAGVAEAIALLAPLAGTGIDLDLVAGTGSRLEAELASASLEQVAALSQTAGSVSAALGKKVHALAGGRTALEDRLMREVPFLLELDFGQEPDTLARPMEAQAGPTRVSSDEPLDAGDQTATAGDLVPVLRATLLHPSDRLVAETAHSPQQLVKLVLQLFPDVMHVHVQSVWAGRVPCRIGTFEPGSAGLHRNYLHGTTDVEWNQARSRYAQSLVAADSETLRLTVGVDVLDRTASFLTDLAAGWVCSGRLQVDTDSLEARRQELLFDISHMAPPRVARPTGLPARSGELHDNDPLHSLADGIVRNFASRFWNSEPDGALVGFAGETLPRFVADAESQPWRLLGLREPPEVLRRIRALLRQVHSVLAELVHGATTREQIAAAAAAVGLRRAMVRAEELAETRASRRQRNAVLEFRRAAAAQGCQIELLTRPDGASWAWPDVEVAALAQLSRLDDLDRVDAALRGLLPHEAVPEGRLILIPMRAGKAALKLARSVHSTNAIGVASLVGSPPGMSLPAVDEAATWTHLLPGTHSTPFFDLVTAVVAVLQELSALGYLLSERGAHPDIERYVDAAADRLHLAEAELADLEVDQLTAEVIGMLAGLAELVQDEFAGDSTAQPLAEVVAGAINDMTAPGVDIVGVITAASLLAHEWDIDRLGALDWFSEISELSGERHRA